MSKLRILDFNYAFQTQTGITATSEDPEFPASNLKRYFRSKIWRSSGTFVIDATNNKINFKESGGGLEKTATIASATYTPTTLAAAIKAALDAAGTVVYTVSFSATTGKWTISTAGAYLSILWLTGTNTATSVGATTGFDVTSDSTGSLTYTGAYIALHSYEAVTFDLLTTEAIDTFMVFFDPNLTNRFSSNAVLKLQANATNVWTAPAVDVTVSFDSAFDVVTHFFTTDQSYRYWRIKITDPKNTNLTVELGKVMLGKATTLARSPRNGFRFRKADQSEKKRTAYGHEYVDTYPIRRSLEVEYAGLTYDNIKTLDAIFERVGSAVPVGIALDPTAEYFDKDHFVVYGKFPEEFDAGHMTASYFGTSFKFLEAF